MPFNSTDFMMDLRKTLTPPHSIWAVSGYSVCAPEMGTVAGVRGCFSPPFAAPDLTFGVKVSANGHEVADTGSKGKGDCGLLYAGGEWLPEKIIRRGTYHYNAEGKIISFEAVSELTPLFGEAGFGVKMRINNRADENLEINITPLISAGHPSFVPLVDWEFTPPKASGHEARKILTDTWENAQVRVSLISETPSVCLNKGETCEFLFAVIVTKAGADVQIGNIAALIDRTSKRWERLIDLASEKLPALHSDIPGLRDYYNRSVLSGLVSLWENDAFVTNPFPATSGADGGSICCYPWDVAGYSARMLVMLLGEKSLDFLNAMLNSGIDRHISMAPDGGGLGWCPYSYSMWSLVNLYSEILKYCGKGQEIFDRVVNIFEKEEERLPEWEHLKDFGRQHNLLEMRTCGYEYFVASPNAERAWCYDRLADIGAALGKDVSGWHEKAELIRVSIRKNLWDENTGWFKCLHPEGHAETVYSIQIFDAVKCGACDDEMKERLFSHLRDGKFLGKYGVSSVSAEDLIHYEMNDPDWSGGGSYTGDGPEVCELLWNEGRNELAWDILKRHFWMGEHLLYYPQEHYCDIPGVPHNKRANIIAGVAGMQAVLFGMAGIKTLPDGGMEIKPNPPREGFVEIKNFTCKDKKIDILLKPDYAEIFLNGSAVYKGEPKTIKL